MVDRRGTRFLVEALFLVALAAALAVARLDALAIVGVMAVGWVVVAAFEWASWRGQPHYGSGLPPRYYVPGVNLPPPQPLEQVGHGYPAGERDEAPTWIASAALRSEVLGEWPLAAPVDVDDDEPEEEEPEFSAPSDRGADPWTVAALPAAPLDDLEQAPAPEPARAPAPAVRAPVSTPGARKALYRLDPLGDPAPRRRFRRGSAETIEALEVDARPSGSRPLPAQVG